MFEEIKKILTDCTYVFAQTGGRLVDLSDFNGFTRRHFYDADALADDIYGAAILIVLYDYFFFTMTSASRWYWKCFYELRRYCRY